MIGIYRHKKFSTIIPTDTEINVRRRSNGTMHELFTNWPSQTDGERASKTFINIRVIESTDACRVTLGTQWATEVIQKDSLVTWYMRRDSFGMRTNKAGKIQLTEVPILRSLMYAPRFGEECSAGIEQGISTRVILETIVHDELPDPLTYSILTVGFRDDGKIYHELHPVRSLAEVQKAEVEDESESVEAWMKLVMGE